jgi:hypothetical protein
MAVLWDLAPNSLRCPDWLPTIAEAISGQTLDPQGFLKPVARNRMEFLSRIRQELAQASDHSDWVVWGRWFLADPATRTVSPFSKITVAEYIKNRVREGTIDFLEEAESLAFGNQELLGHISGACQAQQEDAKTAMMADPQFAKIQNERTRLKIEYADLTTRLARLQAEQHSPAESPGASGANAQKIHFEMDENRRADSAWNEELRRLHEKYRVPVPSGPRMLNVIPVSP